MRFFLHLDSADEPVIVERLDDTHLLVQAEKVPLLQQKLAERDRENTYTPARALKK